MLDRILGRKIYVRCVITDYIIYTEDTLNFCDCDEILVTLSLAKIVAIFLAQSILYGRMLLQEQFSSYIRVCLGGNKKNVIFAKFNIQNEY